MKTRAALLYSVVMILCMMGCAHFGKESPKVVSREDFVRQSLQKAAKHEGNGEWVEALKDYKIALTVDPENVQVRDGQKQMEERLKKLAEERYRAGQRHLKEGKFAEARRELLSALWLRPDYPDALRTLTSRRRLSAADYVVHTLRPGDSLSKLAMVYYGDPAKFTVIARYNQITDADLVRVGQVIKIPLPAGQGEETGSGGKMPELEERDNETPQVYWDWSSVDSEMAERKMPLEAVRVQEADQINGYRELGIELFNQGRYQEALFEFDKVLCVHPDDKAAGEYSCKAHFELGLVLFQMKDYLAAREHFLVSLRYDNDCRQCHAYAKESEELYKEMQYKRGIEFYGKEQLSEAIKAWEMVQNLDPDYKRVDYYIRKAREIQKKLEELKEETQHSLVD
jgi:tetratricopeptide (TPR) repeat protein